MRNADQAHDTDFEDSISSIFTNEKVDAQRGHTSLHLYVYPDQVLSIEKHQGDQLLVDMLREGLKAEPRNISLHETKELVQNFALDTNNLAAHHHHHC